MCIDVDVHHVHATSSPHHSHALIDIYFCRQVEEEATFTG